MAATYRFQANQLTVASEQLLTAAGTPDHIAKNVAEILVDANLTGHDSHGVLRIPGYLRQVSEGRLNPAAEPTVIKETASTLQIDGHNGFGHHTARVGVHLAIDKAKKADMCCVSFINTTHIGRLGEYAEAAARAGCIGLIFYGVGGGERYVAVVPFGGAEGVLSTNPIAVGVPTGDDTPFVLDIATSVVAEGKLQVARSKQASVPEGYIIDKHGQPTTNPLDFYDGGFLLPFGAHKGYGLSLLTCLMGGLSSGSFDPTQNRIKGEFMTVINIEPFMPLEEYQRNVRTFLNRVKAVPPAPGFKEVLVPGDFEARTRAERLANGIDIPETIYNQLLECADNLGISLELD